MSILSLEYGLITHTSGNWKYLRSISPSLHTLPVAKARWSRDITALLSIILARCSHSNHSTGGIPSKRQGAESQHQHCLSSDSELQKTKGIATETCMDQQGEERPRGHRGAGSMEKNLLGAIPGRQDGKLGVGEGEEHSADHLVDQCIGGQAHQCFHSAHV